LGDGAAIAGLGIPRTTGGIRAGRAGSGLTARTLARRHAPWRGHVPVEDILARPDPAARRVGITKVGQLV
jgi:hypothetical protein